MERDIPQLGIRVPAKTLGRFWQICSHVHGQLLNASKLANSLNISHNSIRNYLEILEETFMIRLLKPYFNNAKKRLIKSPKIYIRDSGIVHTLLQIETFNDLLGHPVYGFSFEGVVIENLIAAHPKHEAFFYRTAKGDEIDLVLVRGKEKLAFEIKASSSPAVSPGFWRCLQDLNIDQTTVIAPVDSSYPLKEGVYVRNMKDYLETI